MITYIDNFMNSFRCHHEIIIPHRSVQGGCGVGRHGNHDRILTKNMYFSHYIVKNFNTPSYTCSLWWYFCISALLLLMISRIMVLILDGNSKIGAHIRNTICYLICCRHLIRSRAITNLIFSEKTYFPA